jgi:hypothetical protein
MYQIVTGAVSKFGAQTDFGCDFFKKAQQLVPAVARLVSQLSQASRALILQRYGQQAGQAGTTAAANSTLFHSLCLTGTRCQVGFLDSFN